MNIPLIKFVLISLTTLILFALVLVTWNTIMSSVFLFALCTFFICAFKFKSQTISFFCFSVPLNRYPTGMRTGTHTKYQTSWLSNPIGVPIGVGRKKLILTGFLVAVCLLHKILFITIAKLLGFIWLIPIICGIMGIMTFLIKSVCPYRASHRDRERKTKDDAIHIVFLKSSFIPSLMLAFNVCLFPLFMLLIMNNIDSISYLVVYFITLIIYIYTFCTDVVEYIWEYIFLSRHRNIVYAMSPDIDSKIKNECSSSSSNEDEMRASAAESEPEVNPYHLSWMANYERDRSNVFEGLLNIGTNMPQSANNSRILTLLGKTTRPDHNPFALQSKIDTLDLRREELAVDTANRNSMSSYTYIIRGLVNNHDTHPAVANRLMDNYKEANNRLRLLNNIIERKTLQVQTMQKLVEG